MQETDRNIFLHRFFEDILPEHSTPAHHTPRIVPWRLDPSDRIGDRHHVQQGGNLDRMVESVLEIGKDNASKDASSHVVRVHYGEHVVQGKQRSVKKQTNSYKILLIVYNYYPIKLEPEMEGSYSDINRL